MYVARHRKLPSGRPAVDHPITRCGGFTITELIVAATLLVVVMSVVTTLTVRSGRLWQDARHQRLAIDELSNHLERLACLSESDLATALAELAPSVQIEAVLPHPLLTAEPRTDEHGSRLVLHLNWDRLGESLPVTLVGWIDRFPKAAATAAEEESL